MTVKLAKLPRGYNVHHETFDRTNSTALARRGHSMRTVVRITRGQGRGKPPFTLAMAEAFCSRLDHPSVERGYEVAFGRALKQLEQSEQSV